MKYHTAAKAAPPASAPMLLDLRGPVPGSFTKGSSFRSAVILYSPACGVMMFGLYRVFSCREVGSPVGLRQLQQTGPYHPQRSTHRESPFHRIPAVLKLHADSIFAADLCRSFSLHHQMMQKCRPCRVSLQLCTAQFSASGRKPDAWTFRWENTGRICDTATRILLITANPRAGGASRV